MEGGGEGRRRRRLVMSPHHHRKTQNGAEGDKSQIYGTTCRNSCCRRWKERKRERDRDRNRERGIVDG
jgi:hypothetical protein